MLGLAAAGARVVATAARSFAEVEAVAAEAAAARPAAGTTAGAGGAVVPVLADVTRPDDCAAAVAAALSRFGRLDVLVNNAGRGMRLVSDDFLTVPTRFWQVDPAVWRDIVDTNVNGPFLMARAAAPALIASGRGRIVNVSVNHETMRRAGFSPYGPSKAALESETAHLGAGSRGHRRHRQRPCCPGALPRRGLIPPSVGPEARAAMLRPAVMGAAADVARVECLKRLHGPADRRQALAV